MAISGRLKLIYDMIPQCSILSDIGTDHAYIPAYALLNNRCEKALACDVKPGPLERAKRTRKKYNLEDKMELRLGSGLEPIEEHEADVIIMAGMGSYLIIELIEDSFKKAQKALHNSAPMTGQEIIRPLVGVALKLLMKALQTREKALSDNADKYTSQREKAGTRLTNIGEILIAKNDPLLFDWVKEQIRKQKKTVTGLKKAKLIIDEQLREEEKLLVDLQNLLNGPGGKANDN